MTNLDSIFKSRDITLPTKVCLVKAMDFLPRSKHLLISWLQSPSTVILEPPKIKFDTVSTVSPSICHEVMGPHVWKKGNPLTLLVGMQTGTPTMENSAEIP